MPKHTPPTHAPAPTASSIPFPRSAVYALTPQGALLALRIARITGATPYLAESLKPVAQAASVGTGTASRNTIPPFLHALPGEQPAPPHYFSAFKACLQETFSQFRCHIIIGATGIAVRCLAPLIQSKTKDPAVLVLDQNARHVISLLSGHLGRANQYACQLASHLGAEPVITTATDVAGVPAIDVLADMAGMFIPHTERLRYPNAALVAGTPVGLFDPHSLLLSPESDNNHHFSPLWHNTLPFPLCPAREEAHMLHQWASMTTHTCVAVTPARTPLPAPHLVLCPRMIYAGVGCTRGTSMQRIVGAIALACHKAGILPQSLAGLASLTAKHDEQGLLQAAKALGLPLQFFDAPTLANRPGPSFSPKAQERFGVPGVSEAAALAAAGEHSLLVLPKTVFFGVTVALAAPATGQCRER
ncbi:cobalt-precorrin 5A hydrolase [Desulfovibrio cuneatus]|uniref:cobalt-precorrin 5A hydrolase n=1 Tax=Desulfovibrio cuneatus TaxID=159728 RepID=UPI000418B88B|nr:cobalamin biosynthesis protein [Desulfovibrio cuneatus]